VATNLLLEGEDLEALLIQAHAEGGVNAKIVRAEKVRRGGVFGFFAKESFEVAVEIPDTDDLAAEVSPGTPTDGPDTSDGRGPDTRSEPAGPAPGPRPAVDPADGLLGLVDRVSDAERAAARSAAAVVTRALGAQAQPARVLSPAGPGAALPPDNGMSVGTTTDTGIGTYADTYTGSDADVDEPGPRWAEASRTGPGEGPPEMPRPSTTRPEFTALLEQLTADAEAEHRPGRYTDLAQPSAGPRARGEQLYAEAASGEHGFDATTPPVSRIPTQRRADQDRDGSAASERWTPPAAPVRAPARSRGTSHDTGLVEDRRLLRELGVPSAWTRRLRGGDRFSAVLRMLDRMPDAELDADLPVVAVVGPAGTVQWEAHRAALDLAAEDRPRPVVLVPRDQHGRGVAIARSHRLGVCVAAVETDGYGGDPGLTETLQAVAAEAVIAIVDARAPIEASQTWLDALGQVDAIVVVNAAETTEIAAPLQLGVPVIRLDGVPVDRVTWTAVLCARLEAARPAR
jgi:hypothetical protein